MKKIFKITSVIVLVIFLGQLIYKFVEKNYILSNCQGYQLFDFKTYYNCSGIYSTYYHWSLYLNIVFLFIGGLIGFYYANGKDFGVLKNIKKLFSKKVIYGLIILCTLSGLGYIIYLYIQEQENIKIDEYNFAQFEEIKEILGKYTPETYKFGNLKEFNEVYKTNITPANNCYFLIDRNRKFDTIDDGVTGYTFAFALQSKKYGKKYMKNYGVNYFIYPRYDLPKWKVCYGFCYDRIERSFIDILQNPCEKSVDKYY